MTVGNRSTDTMYPVKQGVIECDHYSMTASLCLCDGIAL